MAATGSKSTELTNRARRGCPRDGQPVQGCGGRVKRVVWSLEFGVLGAGTMVGAVSGAWVRCVWGGGGAGGGWRMGARGAEKSESEEGWREGAWVRPSPERTSASPAAALPIAASPAATPPIAADASSVSCVQRVWPGKTAHRGRIHALILSTRARVPQNRQLTRRRRSRVSWIVGRHQRRVHTPAPLAPP